LLIFANKQNMAESSAQSSKSLQEIFQEGLDLFNTVAKCDEPTNSLNVQVNVKKAKQLLEDATRLVSVADVFSSNERIEEVPTEHIQYFLLPALLGSLTLKLTSGDRKEIINTAEVYFKDFLSRCSAYGVNEELIAKSDVKLREAPKTEFESIAEQISTRANKIQRFQEQKDLKEKLNELEKVCKSEHIDDEVKRNYFLTLVKSFVYESIEEMRTIEMEKPVLEYMATLGTEKPKPRRPTTPLKPIIITKNEAQKAVYGAGYPSLPTMTVKEFYDKRVADGIFPDPNKPKTGVMSMQEAALAGINLNDDEAEAEMKEELVEADDEENLNRMRNMDEYKDEHRRGWGNRMNRS